MINFGYYTLLILMTIYRYTPPADSDSDVSKLLLEINERELLAKSELGRDFDAELAKLDDWLTEREYERFLESLTPSPAELYEREIFR